MECSGDEDSYDTSHGISTIDECAIKCQEISDMFAYGTNDYGVDRCSGGSCTCLCETGANDGICDPTAHAGYRLYKYIG